MVSGCCSRTFGSTKKSRYGAVLVTSREGRMALRMRLIICASAVALTCQMLTVPASAENSFSKVDLAPDKKGGIADMQDISKYCGTKPLKVAYSDGWGGNYWRQITRAEFEAEAAKCPNITEVR